MESFAIVEQAVTEAAVANGVQVTLYNPEGVADQVWQYYFSGRSLAAVGKDLTILENVGTLTPEGADALVEQAAGDPPGSPTVRRADISRDVPCIITSGTGSFDLLCGGSENVVVDFLLPPIRSESEFAVALARLQKVAAVVMSNFTVVPAVKGG